MNDVLPRLHELPCCAQGWYLTQLSTLIYVPLFATLAGTGITQQASRLCCCVVSRKLRFDYALWRHVTVRLQADLQLVWSLGSHPA